MDNAFFANNGIRSIALYSECKLTDETPVVSIHLTLALRYSSIFCNTIYILPNAQINVCKHGLTNSLCQSYKGKHKPTTIIPF